MSKNILYISYDGMTDPLGQSQVIPYLQKLSELGYLITILSTEKKDNYDLYSSFIANILTTSGIKWEFVWYTKKPPVISTIKDIHRLRNKACKLHKDKNFDIVHCRSYIAAFVGLYMKKQFNTKFVFDMRGFYADERVDGKIWNLNNPVFNLVYNFFKKKEIQFLSEADAVISLTDAGKTEIKQWQNLSNFNFNISVIPCCADFNHFSVNNIDKKKQLDFKNDFGITNNDFVVSYLGSIGTWYLLDEMFKFFGRLLLYKPNSKFLFITKDDKEIIETSAKINNIPLAKIIIQPATRDNVPTMLSLSEISLFFIKPVFSKKASSPTKLAEILGMGIPVIANSNVGDLNSIFENNKIGELVNDFTIEEYDRAVKKIDDILKIEPEKLAKISLDLFSLEKGVKSYDSVYSSL